MKPLASPIPEARDVIELPIDDLAMRVLRHFDNEGRVNRHNLTNKPAWPEHGSGKELDEMMRALAEAYDWLERHGLVAREAASGGHGEWGFITRLGQQVLEDRNALDAVRAGHRLEVDLHPSIEQTARRQFLLGEYDLAVFSALREVEARVRQLSGADKSDIGMKLMADAFKEGGPLRDPGMDKGEANAVMALFRGAIGRSRTRRAIGRSWTGRSLDLRTGRTPHRRREQSLSWYGSSRSCAVP